MKKILTIFLAIAFVIGLAASCSNKNDNEVIEFSFDADGSYTGFSNLPGNYTVEDAEKDGCFVSRGLDVIANDEVWDEFIETAEQGVNASVRMVNFSDDAGGPYFTDVFYNNGAYYLFDSTSDTLEKHPFIYLLTLEGQFGNPVKDSGVIVLTDDNTLTFDIVIKSMISSSMDYKQSVSPYRIIMFQ